MELHQVELSARGEAKRSRLLALALVGAAALVVGGCRYDFVSADCKKMKADELYVATGQTCKFRYDQGDVAKYVVVVTRPPIHGDATGEGKFLKYVAKPGFKGQDQLTIKIERRGVGHVQWQTRTLTVRVGPTELAAAR